MFLDCIGFLTGSPRHSCNTYIVVADDTYVREDAEVVVTLTADACKMLNIELKANWTER